MLAPHLSDFKEGQNRKSSLGTPNIHYHVPVTIVTKLFKWDVQVRKFFSVFVLSFCDQKTNSGLLILILWSVTQDWQKRAPSLLSCFHQWFIFIFALPVLTTHCQIQFRSNVTFLCKSMPCLLDMLWFLCVYVDLLGSHYTVLDLNENHCCVVPMQQHM